MSLLTCPSVRGEWVQVRAPVPRDQRTQQCDQCCGFATSCQAAREAMSVRMDFSAGELRRLAAAHRRAWFISSRP